MMHSTIPIKCIIVAFTIMYHGVSGCTYQFINCTYEVFCEYTALDVSFDELFRYDITEKCDNILHDYSSGSLFVPVRLVLENLEDATHKIPEYNSDTTLSSFIVYLDIANKQLNYTPYFSSMENLKIMNLSYNNLHFAQLFNYNYELPRLETLDLSHNLIDSIEVNDNYYMYKNLRSLNISYNYLTYIPNGTFQDLKELDILDISYNHLAIINHYTFDGIKSLKFLYLSSNNISSINLSLFRFSHLEELYLDSNKIEKITQQDFDKLSSLRILNLDFNEIDRINEETFNSLISLTTITMRHNLLRYVHKDAFSLNNNLKNVDFSSNQLNNLPKNLFRYKNITSFSVSENFLQGPLFRGIFEGLQLITVLDLSFQGITAIEEYAFFGLEKLVTLLLNNNNLRTISKLSFKTLKNLNVLDLSNNFIISLDFDKADLISLESLSLKNNFITEIQHEDLKDLNRLRFLDITSNNISNFEPNSFISLVNVESFEIFNNPLSGALINNSFQGLVFPPILDLSCSFLTSVENGSFNGMSQLQFLNLSHSHLEILEYNAFVNTGSLILIDLSYNKLNDFNVDCSDVKNLTTLYLNNNYLLQISNNVFKGMLVLNKLVLSHNRIESIDHAAFEYQINLHYLDLSFNYNLTFHISMIDKARNLEKLFLSGLKNKIDFKNVNITSLRELEISHTTNIFNVSELSLDSMTSLENLVLKDNSVARLEVTDFHNINGIKMLDLSLNRISFIQPGTFKENIFLYKLNLSHNLLTSLSYGIFRGLTSLEVLDVSFNSIHDLHRARFYDTKNLKILIADNNKITEVSEDFGSLRLDLLSIGDNLLSCEKVSYMKYRQKIPVSSIYKHETNKHNVDGITCENNNKHVSSVNLTIYQDMNPVLDSIKDLLLNISKTNTEFKILHVNNSNDLLKNISDTIHDLKSDQIKEQIQLKNITHHVADEVDITNEILERILKVIIGLGTVKDNTIKLEKHNGTDNIGNGKLLENNSKINDFITDISEMKQELLYLENIISEIDKKLTKTRILSKPSESQMANKTETDMLVDRIDRSDRSFIFVEVCVSLIIIIMVCFFLYKFYQSKMLKSGSRSLSTQHITESMDNTNL